MENNKPLYRYYVENGELKHLSTTNYEEYHDMHFVVHLCVPAGELGLKTKLHMARYKLNTLTGKHNVFTYELDDEKVRCLFDMRIKEIQSNIKNELKIIERLTIK